MDVVDLANGVGGHHACGMPSTFGKCSKCYYTFSLGIPLGQCNRVSMKLGLLFLHNGAFMNWHYVNGKHDGLVTHRRRGQKVESQTHKVGGITPNLASRSFFSLWPESEHPSGWLTSNFIGIATATDIINRTFLLISTMHTATFESKDVQQQYSLRGGLSLLTSGDWRQREEVASGKRRPKVCRS